MPEGRRDGPLSSSLRLPSPHELASTASPASSASGSAPLLWKPLAPCQDAAVSPTAQIVLLWLGFAGTHLVFSSLPVRQRIVARVGEGPFQGLYSLVALDRKTTRLNSSHVAISYAAFCLKKKHRPRQGAPLGLRRRT